MDTSAYLYIDCGTTNVRDRFHFFLDPKTRPDFPDDVAENEAHLVRHFEGMPEPQMIRALSDRELIAAFADDAFEAKQLLPAILGCFSVSKAIWAESDIEHEAYYRLVDGGFEFFYSPGSLESEDDDRRYNRNLPASAQEELLLVRQSGIEKALLYLSTLL